MLPTIDPAILRSTHSYADDAGIYSIGSQWGGGKTLWVRRISPPNEWGMTVQERMHLSHLKMPYSTPQIVRRTKLGDAEFWVSWDRANLAAAIERRDRL